MGSAATMLATFAMGVGVTGVTAQDADTDANDEVEEVVVTGTRIRNANISSPSPVTTVGAAEINARGVVRIEDLLQSLPQAFTSNGNGNFGGAGTANVNLRGLTANRTLVLANGKRLSPGPANQASPAPDLNQIPGQLIERVEILTGGASAVYGADAVAGVVNFIYKTDFEGIQIDGQLGINQTSNDSDRFEAILEQGNQPVPGSALDGFEYETSIIVGANTSDGKGNVTAYFTYRDINAIQQSDRVFSACAFGLPAGGEEFICLGSTTTIPARITDFGLAPIESFDLLAFDLGTGQTRDFLDSGIPNDTFNFASTQRTQAPNERFAFGTLAHYEVFEGSEAYLEFNFANNSQQGQIGPSGVFFTIDTISCNNPFLSPAQVAAICTANGLSGDDLTINQELGEGFASIGRRFADVGPRQQTFDSTTFRVVAGLRGEINDSWSYDVSGLYSQTDNVETTTNAPLVDRVEQAIDSVVDADGNIVCRDPSGGCVPLDIFSAAGPNPAAFDFINVQSFESGRTTQEVLNATFTGDLAESDVISPWADTAVQVVGGFEYRRDFISRDPDSNFIADNVGGFGQINPVQGSIDVYEFFAELAVPLIEGAEFAEELTVTGQYRFSDFSTTGAQNTYSAGVTWSPTSDVRLRFNYARATRSPNVFELFFPTQNGLFDLDDTDGDGIFDPCAGATPSATFAQCANTGVTEAQFGNIVDNPAGQFNSIIGGNPNLDEEIADTITIGAVFTPSFVPGLTLSVDYFDIEVEDFIGTIPPVLALNECLENGTDFFCSLIQRDAGGGLFVNGDTSNITATNLNTGSLATSGIDITAQYGLELGDGWGNLNFDYAGTYLIDFVEESLPEFPTFDCAGLFGGSCNGQIPRPEYSHRLLTNWRTEAGVDVNVTWRRVGSFLQQNGLVTSPNFRASAQNYFDVSVNFEVVEGARIRVGINNLFDNQPPVFSALPAGLGTGNTFPSLFDTRGRFGFLGFTLDL
jgi:outer membrane receptor protein involved in Fe transport